MWEESEKEFLFELYNWKLKKKKKLTAKTPELLQSGKMHSLF